MQIVTKKGKPREESQTINMSSTRIKQIIFLQLLGSLFLCALSCNSKTDDEEQEIVVTPAIVAVKEFSLKANDSILAHLDSVFFSIDLNTGVIFNADSLPKGTDVSRLIASITFANSMTRAELKFLKDNEEETTVDYLTNPDDSIDFSHPVTLDVTAQDGTNSFTYQIRVNIHTQEPDTLIWDKVASMTLPSRYENPVTQKTVKLGENVITLIEEYNGEYTLSNSNNLKEGVWTKTKVEFSFIPKVESFTATTDKLMILGEEGTLYESANGIDWDAKDHNWVSIFGGYGSSVLGVSKNGEEYFHSMYPKENGFIETPIEDGFPIFNSSPMGVVATEWYPEDFAILACGEELYGEFSNNVWAYDGETWAVINDNSLPSLSSPMMARYIVYRDTPYVFTQRAFDVWLLFGGTTEDGKMNRNVYLSYNNGVNWQLAPDMMQLPETIPSLKASDIIVEGYDLSADLSEQWTPIGTTRTSLWTRTSYTIDGYEITWVCPYLYIFGGYTDSQELSTEIWRGVLARLEFTPLI